MATKNIALSTWAFYNGGWYPRSDYTNTTDAGDSSAIGAYVSVVNGTNKYRVVMPVEIPAIEGPSGETKTLTVTVSLLRQNNKNNTADILCQLRTEGRGGYSTTAQQGEQIDGDKTEKIYFGSGSEYDDPRTVTFSFDLTDRTNDAETLYLWIMGATTTESIFIVQKGNVHSATLTYTAYSKPTSPSITASPTIYTPSSSITVAWTGGASSSTVSIKSYTLKILKGSAAGTVLYTKTGISSSLTNYAVKISDFSNAPSRGDELYASIQAIGSVDGYDGTVNSNKIGKINRLPGAPTYTSTGTSLNTANSISYTVTAGTDLDSQTVTLYYSLNGRTKKSFTNPLKITTSTDGVVSGSNSIVFYSYDTREYSAASTPHTFTAVFAPVIGTVNTTHTVVQDMNGNSDTYLASGAKITFSMTSGTPTSVKLYVRTGDRTSLSGNGTEVSNSLYQYNSETKTINIPNIFNISAIGAGKYYQFAFKVNDGTTDSDLTDWQSVKRKPYAPRLPKYTGFSNHADNSYNAVAISTYYKDKVTFYFTNPAAATGYAKIESLKILYNDKELEEHSCNTSPGKQSATLNLSDKVNANVSTAFKFKIVDVAGQSVISGDAILTLTKSSELAFGGGTINITTDNLRPLANSNPFQIRHPIAQASGTEQIVYLYDIKVGNNSKRITQFTSEKIADEIQITITAANINAITKELAADWNSSFDSSITVTAADGFAATTDIGPKNFTVNFTEPPDFIKSDAVFSIKHDYYTSNSVATVNMGTAITTSLSSDPYLVNSGEGIIFVLPKASDPNDDIDLYRIYLARNDFYGRDSILDANSVTYSQKLIDIPYDTLLNGAKDSSSDGNFYYRYKTSRYSKNEYFYFKLQVIDKTGNPSRELICPYGFVGCRTVEPLFSAGNIRVDRNGTNVTLNYDFKITDLGGSATKNGWTFGFYDSYPNFERSISGYTPKASLVIEIAPNQDFKEEETISNASNPIVFTPGSNKKLYEFTHKQTKLSGFAESHAKIFMRFILTVSYGLYNSSTNATISSIPQVYTYFGSVPTVAHRAHRVGINTTSLDQDDVFVVENYQGTRYVVFKGTDATNAANSYEVRIDLLEGKIYGYRTQGENKVSYLKIDGATIDGGEW